MISDEWKCDKCCQQFWPSSLHQLQSSQDELHLFLLVLQFSCKCAKNGELRKTQVRNKWGSYSFCCFGFLPSICSTESWSVLWSCVSWSNADLNSSHIHYICRVNCVKSFLCSVSVQFDFGSIKMNSFFLCGTGRLMWDQLGGFRCLLTSLAHDVQNSHQCNVLISEERLGTRPGRP